MKDLQQINGAYDAQIDSAELDFDRSLGELQESHRKRMVSLKKLHEDRVASINGNRKGDIGNYAIRAESRIDALISTLNGDRSDEVPWWDFGWFSGFFKYRPNDK